jgi:hypothetical protein
MLLTAHAVCCHRIVREEGVAGLFRGAGPTVVRAMALNMGMLASNDQVHTRLRCSGLLPPHYLHVAAAGAARASA